MIGHKINQDVTISGTLTVRGPNSTIRSTSIKVFDQNIELGAIETPTDASADGGGITVKGLTDKTIIWDLTNSNWTFSHSVNLSNGNSYKINNVEILSHNSLGSTIVNSSLTSVGTLALLNVSGNITKGGENVATENFVELAIGGKAKRFFFSQ